MVQTRRPIRAALQGGGAYGAYTWGVLDALLASRRVELTHFSGTSAGALNAAICASAMTTGGRREARLALASFWRGISNSPIRDFVGLLGGPIARTLGRNLNEWLWTSAMAAPYSQHYLPEMTSTPLAGLLERHVDIDALRSPQAPPVYITITNVRTGLPRVVTNAELTIDVLLASACLPQFFQPVVIDGEWYWDGGYTGNPTLWPLIQEPGPVDICLVQLSPGEARQLPGSQREVKQRIGEVVFHSPLVAEMYAIAAVRSQSLSQGAPNRFNHARFHRIGPPPVDLVERGSPADRSAWFIEALADAGRSASRQFMFRHGDAIGDRETFDIGEAFVDQSNQATVASDDRKPASAEAATATPAGVNPDGGTGPRAARSAGPGSVRTGSTDARSPGSGSTGSGSTGIGSAAAAGSGASAARFDAAGRKTAADRKREADHGGPPPGRSEWPFVVHPSRSSCITP